MNEHLYYALKHFCKYVGVPSHGLGETYWTTPEWFCELYVDDWECEGDEYRLKFTYRNHQENKTLELVDNYTCDRLYSWLMKR